MGAEEAGLIVYKGKKKHIIKSEFWAGFKELHRTSPSKDKIAAILCSHHGAVIINSFLFVITFYQFDYYVSWCVPSWIYPVWDSLCFLGLSVPFTMLEKFSVITSSNTFSGPFLSYPSGTPIIWMWVHLMWYQWSLRLPLFLLLLYSVLQQWFPPVCLPAHLFMLQHHLFCY